MTDELIGGMIRQAIIELESHHGARKAYPVTSKLLEALEVLRTMPASTGVPLSIEELTDIPLFALREQLRADMQREDQAQVLVDADQRPAKAPANVPATDQPPLDTHQPPLAATSSQRPALQSSVLSSQSSFSHSSASAASENQPPPIAREEVEQRLKTYAWAKQTLIEYPVVGAAGRRGHGVSCAHRHITWPRGPVGSMRVACLDCAASLPYSWERMAIGETEKRKVSRVPGLRALVALFGMLRALLAAIAGTGRRTPSSDAGTHDGTFARDRSARTPVDSHRSGPRWEKYQRAWLGTEIPGQGSHPVMPLPSSGSERLSPRWDGCLLGQTPSVRQRRTAENALEGIWK